MTENVDAKRENVVNEIKMQYGQVNLTEGTETVKTPGLAFRGGGIYIGLKVVQKYNERTGKIEKKPQLVAMQGDIYLDFPINGKWWGDLADFASTMSEALEGVALVNVNTSGDVKRMKQLMAEFRTEA